MSVAGSTILFGSRRCSRSTTERTTRTETKNAPMNARAPSPNSANAQATRAAAANAAAMRSTLGRRNGSSTASSDAPARCWSSAKAQTLLRAKREPCTLTGRKLENRPGTAAAGHAPRLQVGYHTDDRELAIEEDCVDREAHEPGMDGADWAEEKSFARRDFPAPEKPLEPRERVLGDTAALAHGASVRSLHSDFASSHASLSAEIPLSHGTVPSDAVLRPRPNG